MLFPSSRHHPRQEPSAVIPLAGICAGGLPERAVPSAPESVLDQKGESPIQACALRPVTEGNCVAVRRGGEQPKVNHRSVG